MSMLLAAVALALALALASAQDPENASGFRW